MKKSLNISAVSSCFCGLLIAVMSFSAASCTKFLDGKPEIAFVTDNFFTDTVKLSMACLGCYEPLAREMTYGNNLLEMDNGTDISMTNNLTVTASGNMPTDIGIYNIAKYSSYISNVWQAFYEGINCANTIIACSEGLLASDNEDVRRSARKYVAEAKVMRALYYFEIVTRWGDAPLRLDKLGMNNLYAGRTPRMEINDVIIADLEAAIVDLPWYDNDLTMRGRANRGMAMALLSKICLFAGGWSLYQDGEMHRPDNYLDYYRKAELYTRELIASGKHSLYPDFEGIFRNLGQNVLTPEEVLYAIDFSYVSGNYDHAGRLGVYVGVNIKNNDGYKTSIKNYTHYHAASKYAEGDLRRDVSVGDYELSGTNFTKENIALSKSNKWTFAKWRRDWCLPLPNNYKYSDTDYPLLRYAEVLLMRAEVLNELNGAPTLEAVELVNMVRRRAYGLPVGVASDLADIPVRYRMSKDAFFAFLTDEYAREFLGEAGRKAHLIRWNLLKTKLDEVGDFFDNPDNFGRYHSLDCVKNGGYIARRSFKHGVHELWPIPMDELTENNGIQIDNNPGY